MNVLPSLDRAVAYAGAATDQVASSTEAVKGLLGFLHRQYRLILAIVAASLCFGLLYMIATPSSYTATATLIIDTRKNQLFQQQSVLGDIPIDSAAVESQVQILKSETIALAVIKDLHLTDDPEFGGRSGLLGMISGGLAWLFAGDSSRSDFETLRRTAEAFSKHLTVRRVGLTYIIEISFTSLSSDRAAQIANAVAEAYVVDQLDSKYKATKRASVWLQDRIKELRDQASAAERAVVAFKANNNIVEFRRSLDERTTARRAQQPARCCESAGLGGQGAIGSYSGGPPNGFAGIDGRWDGHRYVEQSSGEQAPIAISRPGDARGRLVSALWPRPSCGG